jgi:hypothetical protein
MSLKGRSWWVVNIRMDDREKLSLCMIGRFVEASQEIRFEVKTASSFPAEWSECWSGGCS